MFLAKLTPYLSKLTVFKPYLIGFWNATAKFIVPFLLGVFVMYFYCHRDVVIPKDNPVVEKDIQKDKKEIKDLDKDLDKLKKKDIDRNPVEYWKNN
jgi:hypothetical protein